MHKLRLGITVVSMLALVSQSIFAATLVLEEGVSGYTGTADATLYENRPSNSNGAGAHFFAGVTKDASPRRALLRFDLAAIPAGSTVSSASLILTVDQSRPSTDLYTLHAALAAWNEGSVDAGEPGGLGAAAATGDATWSHRQFGFTTWSSLGGDYGTTSAQTFFSTAGTSSTFSSIAMVATVQNWVSNPLSNFGWIILGDESTAWNAHRFVSSEGTIGQRPRLIVIYTPPARIRDWDCYD
ncbi:MAG: DNRLRE domain-containing protein [Candidatus Sumerlaeaceae bacterium]|nr:DNRLRE domain-containing protein [Candidatus Sumerlaeaceae bacterium]